MVENTSKSKKLFVAIFAIFFNRLFPARHYLKIMRTIKTKQEYKAVSARIEELLELVNNKTPTKDKNFIELDLLSDLIADYEEVNEPIKLPTFIEVIKLRMYERGLNQKRLSELIGVSTSRISEYLNGKSEPPLKIARDISIKLDIDPRIVLGI